MAATHRKGWCGSRLLWLAGAVAAVSGCASAPSSGPEKPTTRGETSYRSVAKDDTRHYQLALGEISTGAVPWDHAAPVYPPTLLDQRLPPRDIAAQLIVNEQGKVSEVRIADEAQADANTRLFDEAVRAAAMQWTFEPLRVSQWASDANGNTHEVSSEARPFSLDYVFHFAWKDGKPVADASAPAGASR